MHKQQAQHEKWVTEGKELNEKAQQINTEWSKWLKANKLPETDAENLSLLQEQWQRIFSEEGKGKILALRLNILMQSSMLLPRGRYLSSGPPVLIIL